MHTWKDEITSVHSLPRHPEVLIEREEALLQVDKALTAMK